MLDYNSQKQLATKENVIRGYVLHYFVGSCVERQIPLATSAMHKHVLQKM